MLYVVCTNIVEKEKVDAFTKAAKAHVSKSMMVDKGCISFDVSKYNEEAKEVIFVEKWESKELLDVHAQRCKQEPIIKEMALNRVSVSLKVVEID